MEVLVSTPITCNTIVPLASAEKSGIEGNGPAGAALSVIGQTLFLVGQELFPWTPAEARPEWSGSEAGVSLRSEMREPPGPEKRAEKCASSEVRC